MPHYLGWTLSSSTRTKSLKNSCRRGQVRQAHVVQDTSYPICQLCIPKVPRSMPLADYYYPLLDSMGWGWDLAFLQPGHHFSTQRKMLRRSLGPQAVGSHDINLESEVAKFMTVLDTFQGHPGETVREYVQHFRFLQSINNITQQLYRRDGYQSDIW
jgi:hypothetical protein